MAVSSVGSPDRMSLAPAADSCRVSCSPTAAASQGEGGKGGEKYDGYESQRGCCKREVERSVVNAKKAILAPTAACYSS